MPPDILPLGFARVVRLMPMKPRRGTQGTRKRNERTATRKRTVGGGRSAPRQFQAYRRAIRHAGAGPDARERVVLGTQGKPPLGAQGLAVQRVALEVADHAPVQVDLVQVPAAVVEVVEGTPVRQGGAGAVAQSVVGVPQGVPTGLAVPVQHLGFRDEVVRGVEAPAMRDAIGCRHGQRQCKNDPSQGAEGAGTERRHVRELGSSYMLRCAASPIV